MGTSKRRSYTKEQRAAAVADVPALGVIEAAKKHGVPQSCASRWAKDAGVRRGTLATLSQPAASTHEHKRAAPAREAKGAPAPASESTADTAGASRRNEPAVSGVPVAAQLPARRRLTSRVAKLYTPSQKALVLEDAAKDGVTVASNKHGVSRFSIYAWQRKVAKAAQGEGPSPPTGPSPCDIEAQRDKEILDEWHRHPGLGPSQIVAS